MSSEVRRQLSDRFPWFMQPMVTYVTGEPADGEAPLINHTPATRLVTAMMMLGVGIAMSLAWLASPWVAWVFPLGLLLTTGAMRTLYVGIAHHASHGTVADGKLGNAIIGEAISFLLVTMAHDRYRIEHAQEHHSPRKIGTSDDPDLRFLLGVCGFLPGKPRHANWAQVAVNIASPAWHLTYLLARARGCVTSPLRFGAVLTVQALVLASFIIVTGSPLPWLLSWVVPLVIGFQCSAMLQFLCEHQWLASPGERVTVARFLGDPPPEYRLGWALWLARFAFLHAPARLAVLVSDLPQHDLHHVRIKSDWPNAAFARRLFDEGNPGRLEITYGSLFYHIDRTFARWEGIPTPMPPNSLE